MDDQQRARELLLAQYIADGMTEVAEDFAAGREWAIERSAIAAITAALRAAPEWQPIETAPEGRLVVVGWLDAEDAPYPENYEFDYLEDGLWAKHQDCVEHAHAVAPAGSQMPKEQPPYQWWMDLPAFHAARPQGFVMVRKEAIDWLNGETEEGFECPPDRYFRGEPPRYWWRSVFREKAGLTAARPQGVSDA